MYLYLDVTDRAGHTSNDYEGRRLVRIIRRGSNGSVVTWRREQMVLQPTQGMDAAGIATAAFTIEEWVRGVLRAGVEPAVSG